MIFAFIFILFLAIAIPTAAKTLAVMIAVYGVLQGLKKIPILTQFLTGWKAIAFNVVFSLLGQLVVIPADQLYSQNTFNIIIAVLTTVLGAAGIHGTVKSTLAPANNAGAFTPTTPNPNAPAPPNPPK